MPPVRGVDIGTSLFAALHRTRDHRQVVADLGLAKAAVFSSYEPLFCRDAGTIQTFDLLGVHPFSILLQLVGVDR